MSYTYGGQTMLKTVEISRAKKTAGIAVTYRAGSGEKYATCPSDCKMNCSGKGAAEIDWKYFDALLDAVPPKGVSFTYTHFHWNQWFRNHWEGKTVVNYSTEYLENANIAAEYVPTVVVVPETFWHGRKTAAPHGKTIVRCPAEYRDISCAQCGNGDPLCARRDRNYIIGFTAHGPSKKKAADLETRGGCYADAGNCRIWWNETANGEQEETDGEKLLRFAKSLPPRSIIRHHVAGDIGAE